MSNKKNSTATNNTSDDGNAKIKDAQARTQEVADLARINIDLALQRGEKLETLETKADDLEKQGQGFHRQARAVKRHFCANYIRNTILIILVVAIIIIIIYFSVAGAAKSS